MIIAVDMDDTMVGLLPAWVNHLNKAHGLNVKVEDILEWDMRKAFPTLLDKEIYGPLETEEFWESVVPLPYAQPYLYKLFEEGHTIRVVTASHPKTVDAKLSKALYPYFNFIGYKDVIICYDKSCIKADVLIDDGPHNLKDFDGLRFLIHAPHNINADKSSYDYRVNNMKEVYERLYQAV